LRPTERVKGLNSLMRNGDNHAQAIEYDSSAFGVAGNVDGGECR
jgi:hypothetical protein